MKTHRRQELAHLHSTSPLTRPNRATTDEYTMDFIAASKTFLTFGGSLVVAPVIRLRDVCQTTKPKNRHVQIGLIKCKGSFTACCSIII